MLQETLEYSKPEPLTNECVFSEVYHSLIHSPTLETLLNLEHTYAMAVGDVIRQRDDDVALLEQRFVTFVALTTLCTAQLSRITCNDNLAYTYNRLALLKA